MGRFLVDSFSRHVRGVIRMADQSLRTEAVTVKW
jgi:hypothetical protein